MGYFFKHLTLTSCPTRNPPFCVGNHVAETKLVAIYTSLHVNTKPKPWKMP